MGPIWGRQGPGGPHVGPMNFVIWVTAKSPFWMNDHIPQIYIEGIKYPFPEFKAGSFYFVLENYAHNLLSYAYQRNK